MTNRKNLLVNAALVAFVVLMICGCGGKESPYDNAISSLIIGLVVAGSVATLAIRFLRQRNNGTGTKKRGGGAVALSALVLLALTGCGGGNSLATPQAFAGDFAGGNVWLNPDRGGGGPSIQIMATSVSGLDGTFVTETVFFYPPSTTNSTSGEVNGSISASGLVTATVTLSDGGTISIGGGPLHWETNRGGPSRVLTGSVAVIYRPTGGAPQVQYLGSTFELFQ